MKRNQRNNQNNNQADARKEFNMVIDDLRKEEIEEFRRWKEAQQKQDAEAKPQTPVETEQPNGQAEQNDPAPTPEVVQLEKPKEGLFRKLGTAIKTGGAKVGKIFKKVFEVVGVITLIAGGGYAIYRVATRDEDGREVNIDLEERDGKYYYRKADGTLGDECDDQGLIEYVQQHKADQEADS